MQVMAVEAGGALEQHVPDRVGHDRHSPGPGVYGAHPVRTVPGTRLARLIGDQEVNASYHHQSVLAHPGYVPAAWADDGTLEAMEDPGRGVPPGRAVAPGDGPGRPAVRGPRRRLPMSGAVRPHPETRVHSADGRWQSSSCEDHLGCRGDRHPHHRLARRAPPAAQTSRTRGVFLLLEHTPLRTTTRGGTTMSRPRPFTGTTAAPAATGPAGPTSGWARGPGSMDRHMFERSRRDRR